MSLRFYTKLSPKGFKSPALGAALANLGKLPLQMAKIGDMLTKEIKLNLRGRILNMRSGRLHDSWAWLLSAINSGWRLVVGSDVVYARIHEFGGWTGRGHATRIKASRYVSRSLIKKQKRIRSVMDNYMTKLWVQ